MKLLHKLLEFDVPVDDLIRIYILYICSVLAQSCQVWHSSLTLDNFNNLERVKKTALKIILQDEYVSYSHALTISLLFERRSNLCLRFAKSCVRNKQTKDMFPLNPVLNSYGLESRFREHYQVTHAGTKGWKIHWSRTCSECSTLQSDFTDLTELWFRILVCYLPSTKGTQYFTVFVKWRENDEGKNDYINKSRQLL